MRPATRWAPLPVAWVVFSVVWFVFAYGVVGRVPDGVASWLSTVLYSGWSIVMAGLAVGAVVRRRGSGDRIWLPLTAGLVALVTGDLLWDLSAHGIIPTPNDSPSVMDAFYLPAYVAMGITAFRLVRRYHRRGTGAVLDTLIVTAGVVAGLFPLVIHPYQDALSTGSVLARAISVAYPFGDLLLVAATAAGAYTALRVPSLRLLSLAAGCCLVADHVFLQQTQEGTYRPYGSWVDWLWLTEYTLMAAAVLIPLPSRSVRLSEMALAQRVSTLVASALLCPALFLIVQLGFFDDLGRPATEVSFAVSTLVLVCLVCARLAHLLFENARTVDDLRRALADAERLSTDLNHQALHDAVTGLPNRRQLADRLRLARGPHAVVAIDLDDFTAVNDDLGPAVGDMLLREVAGRLQGAARPGDLVARLGGDEFAVLMAADPAGEPEQEAVRLSKRLLDAVSTPIVVGGRSVSLGGSAGVAVIDENALGAADPEVDGLVRADVAMYAAKRAGRNRVLTYTSEMRAELLGGTGLAGDLARALRDGELEVAYQPIIDLAAERPTSLEALVRWNHPTLGPLSPLKFLPLAVERGLIAELDLFVLERSLVEIRAWRSVYPELRVGFNASAELLARDDVAELVLGALARHGLPGAALTTEVTEQSLIDEPTGIAERLQRLRDAGVAIALDDFGTGYSSLSYLQELPVDVLKLDRSFVTRGVTGEQVSPLVRTVIDLGHELGLRVLAEGIETAGQERALLLAGCDLGQGWLFSAALPAGEVDAALVRLTRSPGRVEDNLTVNAIRPRGAR